MDAHTRDLRYFLAVAEELSFTRAAERLFISQPALSKQVRSLERTLRVALFDRRAGKVRLTTAGHALVPHAHAVTAAWATAREAVAEASSSEERTVVIGLSTAVRPDLLANVTRTFSRMHPGHRLRVRQSTFEDASAGLADGECDVAFVWLPIPGNDAIAHTVLFEEPRHVALPGDHHLAGRKAVSFDELVDEPFLALPEETGPQRAFWLAEEERGGRPARIGAVVRGPEEAVAALNAGLGVALISASNAAMYPRAGYITVPVLGLRTCALAVAWRKANTRIVVRDLVDAAVAVATERVAAPA